MCRRSRLAGFPSLRQFVREKVGNKIRGGEGGEAQLVVQKMTTADLFIKNVVSAPGDPGDRHEFPRLFGRAEKRKHGAGHRSLYPERGSRLPSYKTFEETPLIKINFRVRGNKIACNSRRSPLT